jgi:hypothetical protein
MSKEPILQFKLSKADEFHCSACIDVADEGAFTLDTSVSDLVRAFKSHVQKYHSKGEDFNQAAFRAVQETIRRSES